MEVEHDKEKALRYKEEGNAFYKAQNYTKAIEFYNKAIALYSKEASFYMNKAVCYFNLKRYHKCIEESKKAVELDSESFKGYRYLAQSYLHLGNIAEAKEAAAKALNIKPSDQNVVKISDTIKIIDDYNRKYLEALEKKDYPEALSKLEYIINKCPELEEFQYQLADLLIKNQKFEKARSVINQNYIQSAYIKAYLEFHEANLDKAKQILNNSYDSSAECIRLKKQVIDADNLKNKGNEALKAKKWQEAINFYEQALKIDPENGCYNAIIYANMGLVFMKQEKLNEALSCLNKSIKQNKNYWKGYLRRGEIYNKQGKYEQAVADYHKVQEIDPKQDMTTYLKAAQSKIKKKDYYEILGVSKTATDDEIKKAFKKKALQYHPDRHRSKSEEEQEATKLKFKELNEAFQTLSDPKKRKTYDMGGEDMFSGMGGGGHGAQFQQADLGDIFKMFGGGGFGGGARQSRGGMGGMGGMPGGFSFSMGGDDDGFGSMGGMGGGMGGMGDIFSMFSQMGGQGGGFQQQRRQQKKK
ncbi:DnaJ domain [Pseudocohnilembus persalinus]|uniref:DnaJ domain n=1 Tax=Pseudocohnilembus persalinus TaxID=266149 RepID=A0A0V0QQH6_PSEPJ|nr:DnaJ domain [Pseudocohnilembus persalinus]|eukprot:KRX04562.1 DnaJ domain [Pseudocohnilembus persalinus]